MDYSCDEHVIFDNKWWIYIHDPNGGAYKRAHHGIEIPSWILLDAIMYNNNNMNPL